MYMPAVSAVAGLASIPTGHASHLNPAFLGVDAVGTGALTFTTGVNLFKWSETLPGLQQYLDEQPG